MNEEPLDLEDEIADTECIIQELALEMAILGISPDEATNPLVSEARELLHYKNHLAKVAAARLEELLSI